MSRILFLVNHEIVIYNFRLEIVERFLEDGHEVHISSPGGEKINELVKMGVFYHEIEIERHGLNPMKEMQLLNKYKKLMENIKPDIVLGFTIKPNIYGAIAARKLKRPFIANITGLGMGLENPGIKQKILVLMYRYAFKNIKRVFFQNEENRKFFVDHKIAIEAHDSLPGSGVNLKRYPYREYPNNSNVKFLFISRIMKEKGIDHYLEAACIIKNKYPNTEFHVCGFCEKEYVGNLHELHENGTVIYHGMINNVADFMKDMDCIVHPSYYPEGLSNVLLEGCATGRPIITTDRSGCREVVKDGYNGYVISQKDTNSLVVALEKIINLNFDEKKQMGINARKRVEMEFDRNIVVNKYVNEVESNA